jgi:hypothetical protein
MQSLMLNAAGSTMSKSYIEKSVQLVKMHLLVHEQNKTRQSRNEKRILPQGVDIKQTFS